MMQQTAIVFPGQGSQSVGMLNIFQADYSAIVNSVCQEASDVLGYDMASLIATDPKQQLDQTAFTQPALLTASIIAWRVLLGESDSKPGFLAGHSLGEYSALVAANALSFADALRLVAKRGELMQNSVAPGVGAMAAILGLDLEQINKVCLEVGSVQAANLNAPGQIVIAGTAAAVAAASEKAKQLGAKRAITLAVSVPSHCALMQPAADEFANYLAQAKWHAPEIPVVQNFDVAVHSDPKDICRALVKQLSNPVRWIETVEFFAQQGITEIIECGPAKVLTGLNKRIAPALNSTAIMEHLGVGIC